MIAIDYQTDVNEVLAALPTGATAPFDRPAWWRGLAEHCGLRPLFARARAGDEGAMLPLMPGQRRYEALANHYNFTWRPRLTPGAEPLLAALARDLAGRIGRITLAPLPDEDGSATQLAAAFAAAGWVVERAVCDTNHYCRLTGADYAAYLARRPGPLRTTLARKAAKVTTQVLTQFDAAAWAAYQAVYTASWKPPEGHPGFLAAFAREESAAGRLRLGLAHAGGSVVAAQFWTVEAGTAFIHKLAHRSEADRLSPGSVLTAAMLRHAIEIDAVKWVDFGTGDEPYKRDWMEASRPRWRLDMFWPRDLRQWPHILRAGARRLSTNAGRAGTRIP